MYSAGNTIAYSGTATDAEDGNLPASAFTWEIVFHHDTHTHPFVLPTSGSMSGTFTIPTSGETSANVFYRIHLTVHDSAGQMKEVLRDVLPRTSHVTLATSPAGLSLTLDGTPISTPYTFTGVVGMVRTIAAPSPQTLGSAKYMFQSWSDGGRQSHQIATPTTDTILTATYKRTGKK
jgi:hypothetical protein